MPPSIIPGHPLFKAWLNSLALDYLCRRFMALHALENTSSPGAVPARQGIFVAIFAKYGRKQSEAAFGMGTIPIMIMLLIRN
jgi:hypothetical protein